MAVCSGSKNETNNVNFKFDKNNKTWSAHVPLPTDDDFMFTKESIERQKNQLKVTGYNVLEWNSSNETAIDGHTVIMILLQEAIH